MRAEVQDLLQRQAAWQRSRVEKSWAEKLKESAALRESLADLKKRPVPLGKVDKGLGAP